MPEWIRQPTTKPVSGHERDRQERADQVGDGVAGQHAGARDRQRVEAVDRPVVAVVGERDRDAEAAEDDRLGEDPAHQELLVAAAARHVDRAAEDEREQQHEHDRLDRRVRQRLGLAAHVQQPAPGDHPRVGQEGGAGAGGPRERIGPASAVWVLIAAPRDRRDGDGGCSVGLRGCAGQRQEHVVERRLGEAEVLDADLGVVERLGQRGDRGDAAARSGRDDRARADVDRRLRAPATRSTIAATASRSARSATTTRSWSPPTWRLRLRASPRAITRPWSTTTMSSARRSASSRYCVVSRIVAPPATRLVEHVPEVVARPRVKARRRLVEEQHLGLGDQRRREVEPPAHAAGVLLGELVGRRR